MVLSSCASRQSDPNWRSNLPAINADVILIGDVTTPVVAFDDDIRYPIAVRTDENGPLVWVSNFRFYKFVSPDCLVGKHQACSGDAWDNKRDEGCACRCECHELAATA
jgi:hypothetical protein